MSPGLVGAINAERTNPQLWVDILELASILKRVTQTHPRFKTDLRILANPRHIDPMTINTIAHQHHCYILIRTNNDPLAMLSDGSGCSRETTIQTKLSKRYAINIRPLETNLEFKVDYCGPAAIAIVLAAIRDIKRERLGQAKLLVSQSLVTMALNKCKRDRKLSYYPNRRINSITNNRRANKIKCQGCEKDFRPGQLHLHQISCLKRHGQVRQN